MRIKTFLLLPVFLLLAGCGMMFSTSTITTTEYLGPDGTVVKRVTEQELTDDAMYYTTAAEVLSGSADAGQCGDDCTPGEKIALAAFGTIRVVSGKAFVDKGLSGVEAAASVTNNLIDKSPIAALGLGIYKLADRPSSVYNNGTYSPTEYHWTGNRMNDGNTFTTPYRYDSPNITDNSSELVR